MFYADSIGLGTVHEAIARLAGRHGNEYWQAAPLLEQLAASAGSFSAWRRT
jgi:hypothetical protein